MSSTSSKKSKLSKYDETSSDDDICTVYYPKHIESTADLEEATLDKEDCDNDDDYKKNPDDYIPYDKKFKGRYISIDEFGRKEIYIVKNNITGKRYVGKTNKYQTHGTNSDKSYKKISLYGSHNRVKKHFDNALKSKKGSKQYSECGIFYDEIRKYKKNKNAWEYKIVAYVNFKNGDKLEKKYIDKYDTTDPDYGYNILYGKNKAKDGVNKELLEDKLKKSNSTRDRKKNPHAEGLYTFCSPVYAKGDTKKETPISYRYRFFDKNDKEKGGNCKDPKLTLAEKKAQINRNVVIAVRKNGLSANKHKYTILNFKV